MLALMVGWLVAKATLQEEYPEFEDLPEPLQDFIANVLAAADEFDASLLPGHSILP